MKILFLTNIPSPYRVHFFNELGKRSDLTVLFERGDSAERDASWKRYQADHFKPVILGGVKRGVANAVCPGVLKYLKKGRYDHIVVTNFTSPTGMLAIMWMRLLKIPYWLESDGGFAKSGRGFRERLKRYFIRDAAGYFSTSQEHDRYYLQYGALPERIHRYPFTSVWQKNVPETAPSARQKADLRKKLGMKEQRIILAVGQFIPRKGFDVLLGAMSALPECVGCYIVGGIPGDTYLEQIHRLGLYNVHFVGFQSGQALRNYYMAADVFAHPTREDIWGLVINEAMAYGLPVVTTQRCIAGLELVKDGENGYIVPVGDDAALADRLGRILKDPSLQERMARRSLEKIAPYTIENMAARHIAVFEK